MAERDKDQEENRAVGGPVGPGADAAALSAFQLYHLGKYAEIGMALSGEENVDRLLEMIVHEAREITDADAGTLYLVNAERTHLDFAILHNDTMKTRMGGTSGVPVKLPPVPLHVDGAPNHANVSSYVALSGDIINIADVYESEEFDFTGPRKYDQATGYRSKSMLVIPLRNHENDVIGVLQLLNAQDVTRGGAVGEFADDRVSLVASLASQAAAALTKTRLIQDLKDLFYAFIKSIANAIEEKSPYTGGHINRVVDITMMIARRINDMDEGPFADVHFNEDELEELKLASWLHDIGKITTPEWVVDKASKLQTIYDRVDLVQQRFDLAAQTLRTRSLERKVALLEGGAPAQALRDEDQTLAEALRTLEEDRAFAIGCNEPGEFMSDERRARVRAIGERTFELNGQPRRLLTEDEVANLCIRKGTLTDTERAIIENHARVTGRMLSELPFPKKLARVPQYAAGHHEKLDGSGYPDGLDEKTLPLQARIMAVADIFEALTAQDRPYKKPMPLSQAVKILGFMKKDRHIDPDVHDLFLSSKLFLKYAEQELAPAQFDAVTVNPALKGRRVLVASGSDVSDLTARLEAWGARPEVVADGATARDLLLDAFRDCRPYRLAFVDEGLGTQGLLGELCAAEGFPVYSVIALCDDPRAGAPACAVAARLGLPVDEAALREAVFAVLEGHTFREGVNPALCLMGTAAGRPRRSPGPAVLLVDDSANTRMMLRYHLRHTDVVLDVAANGRQGVDAVTRRIYDMVLMATRLPVMDGLSAARAIRQWERESGARPVPLVAMTLAYIPQDASLSLEAGFTSTVERPVTGVRLQELLHRHLPRG
jgi:HD-GYP domain-containing protein (c-di-GMP phosphodiesterase class II)